MANKRVVLSMSPEVYDEFRIHCEENGYWLSKRLEVLMKKDMS